MELLLAGARLASLVPQDQDIVRLEHNQTVAEALQVLAKHKLLSAPLVVSPGLEDMESLEQAETSPYPVGWVDVKDIIKAFLTYLHAHRPSLPSNMLALMTELEKHGPAFADKMLITVLGSEDRGLVYQAESDVSVLSAITDLFLSQSSGGRVVHRLAMFDAHAEITAIISQLDVLRFLLQHSDQLGPSASSSIDELGLVSASKQLLTLEPSLPTLLAFERLAAAGVTGAPVLSSQGELIANLSTSDVRGITVDHLGVLALPVAEFLALRHNTSYLGYSASSSSTKHAFFASSPRCQALPLRQAGADAADEDAAEGGGGGSPGGRLQHTHSGTAAEQDGVPLITCQRSTTLLEVMRTLVDSNIHRVYCVEKGAQPREVIAVVTPTDILRLLASTAGWAQEQVAQQSAPKRGAGEQAPAGAAAEADDGSKRAKTGGAAAM